MTKRFKNSYVEIWKEDGIVYACFLNNCSIDLKKAKIIVQERLNMHEGIECPVIVFGNIKYADRHAMNHMSQGDAIKLVTAVAIIVSNPAQKVMASFYQIIGNPKTQLKIFLKKNEAIEWLKSIGAIKEAVR
ncbi:MAG: hypothetical protein ACK4ND_10275 [Cytophagaceae bacterium]